MTKLIPFLIAACLLCTGCIRCHRYVQLWLDASDNDGFEPTYENIVGTYHYEGKMENDIDKYELEIFPDSTFIQRYRKVGQEVDSINSGRVYAEGGAGGGSIFGKIMVAFFVLRQKIFLTKILLVTQHII